MKQFELEKLIARRDIPLLLLLYGDAHYMVRKTTESIISTILKPGDRDLGLQHLDSAKMIWPELRDAIDTPPFGLARKVLLIEDMQRTSKELMQELFGYAAASGIPEFTVLLMTGKKVPGGMPRKKKNDNPLTFPVGVTIFPPFENKLPQHLKQKAARLNIRLSRSVPEEIILRAGTDLSHLLRELEKLAVYIHPRTTVEIEDVRRACSGARENVFALVDNVLDGKPAAALQALTDVLDVEGSSTGIMVLRMLQKRFRMVIQARGLIARLPKKTQQLVALAKEHKPIEHCTDYDTNQVKWRLAGQAEKIKKAMRETLEAGENPLPPDKKANLLKQHSRVVLSCFYHASWLNEQLLANALIETARAENMSRDGSTPMEACLDQLVLKLSNTCSEGGASRSGYAEGSAS